MKNLSILKYSCSALVIALCIGLYFLPKILSPYGSSIIENKLKERIGGAWKVENVQFSWFGAQKIGSIQGERDGFSIEGTNFQVHAPLYKLSAAMEFPFSDAIEMENGQITFQKKLLLDGVTIQPSGNQHILQAKAAGNGTLTGTLSSSQKWTIAANNLPTLILDLVKTKYPLSLLFGPRFSCLLESQNNDTTLKFSSPKLTFHGKGVFDGRRATLTAPLIGSYALTKDVSEMLFTSSSLKPVSAKAITFQMAPKTTMLLKPFKLNTLEMPPSILNLNKMLFLNMNTLSDILSVIKLQLRYNSDVPIWFQSMPIQVQKGICTITRSEILVDNSFELATWGSIDLNRNVADVYLALTSQTLQAAFGIDSVPNDYLVPMKIDGDFDDLDFHKSRAMRTIAKLLLLQQSPFMTKELLPDPEVQTSQKREPLPWR